MIEVISTNFKSTIKFKELTVMVDNDNNITIKWEGETVPPIIYKLLNDQLEYFKNYKIEKGKRELNEIEYEIMEKIYKFLKGD